MTLPLKSTQEIRFLRYSELRHEFSLLPEGRNGPKHGRVKRFAEFIGSTPAYISHVNNGRKPIGASLARRCEIAFKKPQNWMDSLDAAAIEVSEQFIQKLALRAWQISPSSAHEALLRIVESRPGNVASRHAA